MRLPRFILRQEFTEKQARHKALNPSKWLESYQCSACGCVSASCGFIEAKQWVIYVTKKCLACQEQGKQADAKNALNVAKKLAIKVLKQQVAGGVL